MKILIFAFGLACASFYYGKYENNWFLFGAMFMGLFIGLLGSEYDKLKRDKK